MEYIKEAFTHIKAFIFDVDGVLGSDKVLLTSDGEMLRTMNIKDGFAMQYAIRKGYKIAIITGGNSASIKTRFENLGITDIYLRSNEKIENYLDFIKKYGIKDEEVLYMGDDLPDYVVMQRVGVSACPITAVDEVKSISKYISPKEGGNGAVRDILEQVLKAQGRWMEPDAVSW